MYQGPWWWCWLWVGNQKANFDLLLMLLLFDYLCYTYSITRRVWSSSAAALDGISGGWSSPVAPINSDLSMISTGCWGRTCRNKWHVQHAAVVANNGNRSTLDVARWLGAVKESTEILFRVQGSGWSRRVHREEDADIGCNLYFGQIT